MAVVGAAGMRGQMILQALADQNLPAKNVMALDYEKHEGMLLPYGKGTVQIANMMTADFRQVRVVLFCLSGILKSYIDDMISAGTVVIDCIGIVSGAQCVLMGRNRPIIPKNRLILNPTDMTLALARILEPIHQVPGVRSAEVTVLLSAENFGPAAGQVLAIQSQNYPAAGVEIGGPLHLKQAFNLILEPDPFPARQTGRQMKELIHFPVSIHTCLAPVFRGEAYSLTLTTRKDCEINYLKQLWGQDKNCCLCATDPVDFPLTGTDCIGKEFILLGGINTVPFRNKTYHLWAACDARYCGAAAHAARLARYLLS